MTKKKYAKGLQLTEKNTGREKQYARMFLIFVSVVVLFVVVSYLGLLRGYSNYLDVHELTTEGVRAGLSFWDYIGEVGKDLWSFIMPDRWERGAS